MRNHQNISIVWMFIALVALTMWAGCAATTTVHGIKPAEVAIGNIRTLAVLKFAGKYGETVRSDFYNKLGEIQHFNLIDTTQMNNLDKVVYDQISDPRYLPILEDLHADGVITGRVTADINDIKGTDQVHMQVGTGQYKKEKNIFGMWTDVEIMRTVLRPEEYTIRQASLSADFKVFDLRSKRIVATGKVTENYNKKFGGDNEKSASSFLGGLLGGNSGGGKLSQLPAKNQTLNELSAKIATKLVGKIAPTTITKEVEFDDGGTYGLYGAHPAVKRGIEFAKRGSWNEAMEIWRDVIKAEPNNASAHYNLGVAYESFGDLKNLRNAINMYKKADRFKSNVLYIKAIARVNTAIKDSQKYKQQQQRLYEVPVKKDQESGGIRIY